jgi:hypothetical protein
MGEAFHPFARNAITARAVAGEWHRVAWWRKRLANSVCFMTMTPEQRAMRARLAALARWSREDPADHVAMMNEKFKDRFLEKVDPEGLLPEPERRRRAEAARKLFYQQLAYKSSRARSKG